jgi:hypothetical protein
VSILSEFEDRIAGVVEGLFAGAFRSPVQPAEVARALARAMDDRRQVGVGKVYAPTSFTVALSPADHEKMGDFSDTLAGELATFLIGYAQEHSYHLTGRPVVDIEVHDDLKLGRFRVSAKMVTAPEPVSEAPLPVVAPAETSPDASLTQVIASLSPGPTALATVTVSDLHHDVVLKGDRVVIGRLSSCGIPLDDVNVSRNHAAFVRESSGWAIEDAGSTNGTYLNGSRVTRERLHDGDVVQIGASELVYHEPRG